VIKEMAWVTVMMFFIVGPVRMWKYGVSIDVFLDHCCWVAVASSLIFLIGGVMGWLCNR